MKQKFWVAVTNVCNRSCEFCSMYSNPKNRTFLPYDKFTSLLPLEDRFEVHFEGGEPLLHPQLESMIRYSQQTDRCDRITVGTNGTLLPYQYKDGRLDQIASKNSIVQYFLKFEPPFLLKSSINYHLIEKDKLHIDKAEAIRDAFLELPEGYEMVFNVRRRSERQVRDADAWLIEELVKRDLISFSRVFYLLRYGQAKNWEGLGEPHCKSVPFDPQMIDPAGKDWVRDLIGRSEAMKKYK